MWLTFSVIENTDKKEDLLFDFLREPQALPITADITRRLLLQTGKIATDDPRLKQEQWLSKDNSEEYIDRWSDLVMMQLLEADLVDSVHASHIYFAFYRASKEKAEKVFSRWLSEESGLEKIAKLIGRCGSDSTNGPYAEISEESLSELLNYKTLRELADNELKNSANNLSTYLQAVYRSILTGEKYYLNDASKGEKF
ncbi:hypothetical protein [Chromohalobacter israelensis]|uniref:hypothetical protein n=1 Tax=Chromohalobacter israelensis TaxID=141390 RepID=UPI000053510D|nr:hypothetical protein [Chromohalobacter salexigens]